MSESWEEKIHVIEEFYHNTACHICKNITPNIKRCSNCKLFAYCSPDHQKIHWKYHKKFCKMIQDLLKINDKKRHHIFDLPNINKISSEEWCKLRSGMLSLWETKLNRQLTKSEYQVLMLPRMCVICRCSKQDELYDCRGCCSVSYCSKEHELKCYETHKKYCKSLRLCYEITLGVYKGLKIKKISFNLTNLNKLPYDMSVFVRNFVLIDGTDEKLKVLASQMLSPSLTILNALETLRMIDDDRNLFQTDLTIHVVGASSYEASFNWNVITNLFYQWIKNLQQLNFVLIGPEVVNEFLSQDESPNRSEVTTNNSLYHDYARLKTFIKPDVIICYNCGFHEYENCENDTWKMSFETMLNIDKSVMVFTSYTKDEAKNDLRTLTINDKNKIVIEFQQNKFASLRPIRDCGSENIPIFYNNNYVSIIKNS